MSTLYRVIQDLLREPNETVRVGTLTRAEWLTEKAKSKLVASGAISPVSAPPLEVLGGFSTGMREKLTKCGVQDALQFLDTDAKVLSRVLGESLETTQARQRRVLKQLTLEDLPPEDEELIFGPAGEEVRTGLPGKPKLPRELTAEEVQEIENFLNGESVSVIHEGSGDAPVTKVKKEED